MTICSTCYDFAYNEEIDEAVQESQRHLKECSGSKLRDTFAAAALTGLMIGIRQDTHSEKNTAYEWAAMFAYKFADAMIEVRKKNS